MSSAPPEKPSVLFSAPPTNLQGTLYRFSSPNLSQPGPEGVVLYRLAPSGEPQPVARLVYDPVEGRTIVTWLEGGEGEQVVLGTIEWMADKCKGQEGEKRPGVGVPVWRVEKEVYTNNTLGKSRILSSHDLRSQIRWLPHAHHPSTFSAYRYTPPEPSSSSHLSKKPPIATLAPAPTGEAHEPELALYQDGERDFERLLLSGVVLWEEERTRREAGGRQGGTWWERVLGACGCR